jgi:hypothetical protein
MMGLSVILAQQFGDSTCSRHPATGDRYPPPHGEYTSHPQPSHGKIPAVLHQTSVILKFAAVFHVSRETVTLVASLIFSTRKIKSIGLFCCPHVHSTQHVLLYSMLFCAWVKLTCTLLSLVICNWCCPLYKSLFTCLHILCSCMSCHLP